MPSVFERALDSPIDPDPERSPQDRSIGLYCRLSASAGDAWNGCPDWSRPAPHTLLLHTLSTFAVCHRRVPLAASIKCYQEGSDATRPDTWRGYFPWSRLF